MLIVRHVEVKCPVRQSTCAGGLGPGAAIEHGGEAAADSGAVEAAAAAAAALAEGDASGWAQLCVRAQ